MEVADNFPLHIAAIAIFFLSLALGVVLLRLRDFVFGTEAGKHNNHQINFYNKIAEEEQLNLDELLRGGQRVGKLDLNCRNKKKMNKAGHRD